MPSGKKAKKARKPTSRKGGQAPLKAPSVVTNRLALRTRLRGLCHEIALRITGLLSLPHKNCSKKSALNFAATPQKTGNTQKHLGEEQTR